MFSVAYSNFQFSNIIINNKNIKIYTKLIEYLVYNYYFSGDLTRKLFNCTLNKVCSIKQTV